MAYLTMEQFKKMERQYENTQWSEYEKKLNEQDEVTEKEEEEKDGEQSETGD